MIQERLDQIKGTSESTLGHSITLTHCDPSGLVTVQFCLHSLGMIWARPYDHGESKEPFTLGVRVSLFICLID